VWDEGEWEVSIAEIAGVQTLLQTPVRRCGTSRTAGEGWQCFYEDLLICHILYIHLFVVVFKDS
jgi:hypothetical protein